MQLRRAAAFQQNYEEFFYSIENQDPILNMWYDDDPDHQPIYTNIN